MEALNYGMPAPWNAPVGGSPVGTASLFPTNSLGGCPNQASKALPLWAEPTNGAPRSGTPCVFAVSQPIDSITGRLSLCVLSCAKAFTVSDFHTR